MVLRSGLEATTFTIGHCLKQRAPTRIEQRRKTSDTLPLCRYFKSKIHKSDHGFETTCQPGVFIAPCRCGKTKKKNLPCINTFPHNHHVWYVPPKSATPRRFYRFLTSNPSEGCLGVCVLSRVIFVNANKQSISTPLPPSSATSTTNSSTLTETNWATCTESNPC